jgi:hypothetical protein
MSTKMQVLGFYCTYGKYIGARTRLCFISRASISVVSELIAINIVFICPGMNNSQLVNDFRSTILLERFPKYPHPALAKICLCSSV